MRRVVLTFLAALVMVGAVAVTAQGHALPSRNAAAAITPPGHAPPGAVDPRDTVWMLASSVLVFVTVLPGLALFYGGPPGDPRTLSRLTNSLLVGALVAAHWVLWGYSLAFGPDRGGLTGSLEWAGLHGVGAAPCDGCAKTVAHQLHMGFQLVLAILTTVLVTGGLDTQRKLSTVLILGLLWVTFVHDPLAHWLWAEGGWLRRLGALDFAGGAVVHISSAASVLACVLMRGSERRAGRRFAPRQKPQEMALGALLLGAGWLGITAGRSEAANGVAAAAFVAIIVAAAAGTLSWTLNEWLVGGEPTVAGIASGAVAGLVSITPAAGFVSPVAAIAIGVLAGGLCSAVSPLRSRAGDDPSIDVVVLHGVGGTWGMLAAGLFASRAINPGATDGAFYGNPGQLRAQLVAILVSWALGLVVTAILVKVVGTLVGSPRVVPS